MKRIPEPLLLIGLLLFIMIAMGIAGKSEGWVHPIGIGIGIAIGIAIGIIP